MNGGQAPRSLLGLILYINVLPRFGKDPSILNADMYKLEDKKF